MEAITAMYSMSKTIRFIGCRSESYGQLFLDLAMTRADGDLDEHYEVIVDIESR